MVLMQGIRIRNLYKMLGKIDDGSFNQMVDPKTDDILSCMDNSTMLWHQRLGHIGEKGSHAMHTKGMVEGLPY